jgi:HlyD family secretion protein
MKRFLIIVGVLVVLGASWLIYSRNAGTPRTTLAPEGYVMAAVATAPVEAFTSATGSLAAARVQPLTFRMAGKVSEVLVAEGDRVIQGQVLAVLDTDDLQQSVRQAKAQMQVNEASLERARKMASAEEIAAAEAALQAAEANLEDLKRGPSARDIELARLSIDQAKNSLWGAQGNRDAIAGNPMSGGGAKTQAEAQVANAELAVKTAELNYAKLFEPPKESAIRSAESQIVQAESNLARLKALPSAEDIRVAEAQLASTHLNVEIAEARLKDSTLLAPFGGQLATWKLYVGDNVTLAGSVGTLVDTSSYRIELSIDETEVGKLSVGQKATITLDAFPNQELEGRVASTSLLGTLTQGIVTYGVTVELAPTQLPIKPLMTAVVDIVVASKERALVVPNRALRRDREGIYVEILENNLPTRVGVTTGLAGKEVTEIIDGLTEGQQVIVGRPRESIFSGGFFGGG